MGVPKSGRATAVGMAIETTFGTPPTTLISGSNYSIGIASTNPERFFKVLPSKGFPVKPTIKAQDKELAGDFDRHRIVITDRGYLGELTWLADPENLYYALLGVFGVDAQTLVQAATSTQTPAIYSHAFQTNKNRGYMPSFTVEEVFGDHVYGRLTSGVVVQKVSITFGDVVTATMSLTGGHQVPNNYPNASLVNTDYDYGSATNVIPGQMGGNGTNTWQATSSPTFCDVAEPTDGDGPLVFANMTYGTQSGYSSSFIHVDGSAYTVDILRGMTLNLSRTISAVPVGGGGLDVYTYIAHEWMIDGKVDLLFLDNLFSRAVLAKKTVSMDFLINGPLAGTSGKNWSMEVFLPNLNFSDGGLEIPASEMLSGGNFSAKQDPTLGYAALVTMVNTYTNASLAGTAGSSPGGLGGWNIAP